MSEVLLVHHALGLTPGVLGLADQLRASGHDVVTPDLFDGAVFDSVEAGVAHAGSIGFDTVMERGVRAADELGPGFVAVGFSLGVMSAQQLAQTDPRVRGAVLCHAAVPLGAFRDTWPERVALQIHIAPDDPWAAEDVEAAEELARITGCDLHRYAGTGHLIADPSSPDHDPQQAGQLLARLLAFVDGLA